MRFAKNASGERSQISNWNAAAPFALRGYALGVWIDERRSMQSILDELPDYRNGPYADLRKWVHGQIDETHKRSAVTHRDSIQVRRQGVAQVALVGAPNAGKSSLLQALSDVQVRTGDYAFTTTRPVPASSGTPTHASDSVTFSIRSLPA